MKVTITGADGFLGWHLRARLQALTDHQVIPVGRTNWHSLDRVVEASDALIHLAGVNRGTEEDVYEGNVRLANDVARALRSSGRPSAIVFANSIQSVDHNSYGRAKRHASDVLSTAAADVGASYTDVHLPNIFGEHGLPDYNSFVATFVHRVISGDTPIVQDRQIDLLHAQSAARALIDGLNTGSGKITPAGTSTTVGEVLRTLIQQHAVYRHGEFPILGSRLETDLFNTMRASMIEAQPLSLTRHSDARGSLVETVRVHGSEGQTFVSTTRPGVTRGQHFHLRKIERFVVVSGTARISIRRLLGTDVRSFEVCGDSPVAVDMPTGWAHNITNVGTSELTTLFWTNELFDPQDSDTYPEEV